MPLWLFVLSLVAVVAMVLLLLWRGLTKLVAVALVGPFATTVPAPSPLGLPSIWTTILGLADGVLTVLVHNNFGLPTTWEYVLSAILVFLGGAGIVPLLGPAFRTALNLPHQVTTVISAAMSALSYFLSTHPVGLSHSLAGWLSGGLAFLAAVGFGTSAQSVVASFRAKGGVVS